MRLFIFCAAFLAAGLLAFSLALSGLGVAVNTVVFAAAAGGLLFTTVNLTSARLAQSRAAAQPSRDSMARAQGDSSSAS